MSAINEAENPSVNTTLSLDISLRVERGNEGKWVVISSVIKEVGPVAVKPIGVNKPHSFKTVLFNGSGPRSFATWKLKAHAGSFKTLGYKSGSQTLNSKTISSVTQTGPLASSYPSDTALRLPEFGSSHAISSFACNSATLPEIGSSHAISSVACNSEVLPEFGSSLATSSSDCNSAVLPGFGLGSSTLSGAIVF